MDASKGHKRKRKQQQKCGMDADDVQHCRATKEPSVNSWRYFFLFRFKAPQPQTASCITKPGGECKKIKGKRLIQYSQIQIKSDLLALKLICYFFHQCKQRNPPVRFQFYTFIQPASLLISCPCISSPLKITAVSLYTILNKVPYRMKDDMKLKYSRSLSRTLTTKFSKIVDMQKRQKGTETPSNVCSQVRKQANPSSWSRLHKRSGQCNYFNHAIYCSVFFLFFFYTSFHMTEKGSTIDPEVEENTRIQSASEKKQPVQGFLPCNKYQFLVYFFFFNAFSVKVAILIIWARETLKTLQRRNTRSELYSSIVKCVEGRKKDTKSLRCARRHLRLGILKRSNNTGGVNRD